MKRRFLFYRNFEGKLCVVCIKKLPLWKRVIYRKRFDIKFYGSY